MKQTSSLRSVDFNDLYIHPGLEFTPKFKCPYFEKYNKKGFMYSRLRLYGVVMAQSGSDDKLMVQTFS